MTREIRATQLRKGDLVACDVGAGEVFLPVVETYWRTCPPRHSGERRYSAITFYVEPVPGHRLPVERTDFDVLRVRVHGEEVATVSCSTCEARFLTYSDDVPDECPKCGCEGLARHPKTA